MTTYFFQEELKAVRHIWTRASDVIHNYGWYNNFFFLWSALLTECLESPFNPSSRGEGCEVGKRMPKDRQVAFLDSEEKKERVSGPCPCICQENQPMSQNQHSVKFVVFIPLFLSSLTF